jgi:hypothetical protein
VHAMWEHTDLDSTEEVQTLFFIAKDIIKGHGSSGSETRTFEKKNPSPHTHTHTHGSSRHHHHG